MKSPTDAFEDAEIAREERHQLADIIEAAQHPLHESQVGSDALDQWYLADTLIAAGYSRQSPASTTAADAWDACLDAIEEYELNTEQARQGNPYRVAAPEGDGGNEQQ